MQTTIQTPDYPIIFSTSLQQNIQKIIENFPKAQKFILVTDQNIHKLYFNKIQQEFKQQQTNLQITLHSHILQSGELNKNLENIQTLHEKMFQLNFTRQDIIIGLGGGLITDFSGFAASMYMRGIPSIYLPTSVLGISDAAVGGKTAVNNQFGKNLIGAFYDPKLIIVNIDFLKTLDNRNFSNGLVEIIKIAMIQDLNLFEKLESFQSISELRDNQTELQTVMKRSMELKLKVVNSDKREADLRKILNFGHTLGHGIEHTSKEQILHGEAVAMGMIFAVHLSHKLNILKEDYSNIQQRLKQIFDNFNIPYQIPQNLDKKQIINYMFLDKKIENSTLQFVLLEKLGQASLKTHPVDKKLVQNYISDQITVKFQENKQKQQKNQDYLQVQIPGSKSITNRILIMAALSKQKILLKNFLFSEDTDVMLKALQKIGSLKILEKTQNSLLVQGQEIPNQNNNDNEIIDIYVANSGTTGRFLISYLLSLNTQQKYKIFGIERMHKRPIRDLLVSLQINNQQNGQIFEFLEEKMSLPLILHSQGLQGGQMFLNGQKSSQFVTSLLMAAPYAKNDVLLNLSGNTQDNDKMVSEDFILMTTQLMEQLGIKIERKLQNQFLIKKGEYQFQNNQKQKQWQNFSIEPDGAAMSYYLQAAILLQKSIKIPDFSYEKSIQGDFKFIQKLIDIGFKINIEQNSISYSHNDNSIQQISTHINTTYQETDTITLDFNDCTDTFITLACILSTLKTDKKFYISNIANQSIKECNRLYAVQKNLQQFGILCLQQNDGLIIHCKQNPQNFIQKLVQQQQKQTIKCYNDHRLAMAFSLLSAYWDTQCKGAGDCYILDNKNCVQKTFPQFWQTFEKYFGLQTEGLWDQQQNKNQQLQSPPIFLVGMRASGKTSLSKFLSQQLNLKIISLDSLILQNIQESNKNIQNLSEGIQKIGWTNFRNIESQTLQNIIANLKDYHNCIIDTGGGIIESPQNLWLLKAQKNVVWIQRDIEEIDQFLQEQNKASHRPLLPSQNEKTITQIYNDNRMEQYHQISNFIFTIPKKQDFLSKTQQCEKLYWETVNHNFLTFSKQIIETNLLENNKSLIHYKEESFFVCLQLQQILDLPIQKFSYINNTYNALEVRSDQYFQENLQKENNFPQIMERFFQKISFIKQFVHIPLIFTLRTKQEGGLFNLEQQGIQTYTKIIKYVQKSLNFQYIDIEFLPNHQLTIVQLLQNLTQKKQISPNIILSKHYIDPTDENTVVKHIEQMKQQQNLYSILKICLNTEHSDQFLQKTKQSIENNPNILIKLGENGTLSRIQNTSMTPVCDSKLSPTPVFKGQLEKQQILSWKQQLGLQKPQPKIIYLFGKDIKLSYSPLIHNTSYNLLGLQNEIFFKNQQVNSVEEILSYMNQPDFLGAAVTMPFKQQIIPYIDILHNEAQQIQTINTILKVNNSQGKNVFHGFNTDIYGIMKPICNKILYGKKQANFQRNALLIGCGATACTALLALQKLKMNIIVWNRNKENLQNFVKNNQKTYKNIQGFDSFSDISKHLNKNNQNLGLILSTIPGNSDIQIQKEKRLFQGDPYIFDISYFPKNSLLKQQAQQHIPNSDNYIQGIDMLLYQAFKQIEIFSGIQPVQQQQQIINQVQEKYNNDSYL